MYHTRRTPGESTVIICKCGVETCNGYIAKRYYQHKIEYIGDIFYNGKKVKQVRCVDTNVLMKYVDKMKVVIDAKNGRITLNRLADPIKLTDDLIDHIDTGVLGSHIPDCS